MSTAPPPLAADLNDGLKRLKMAAMRRLAPELLVTARTQRWNPEEFLRTLVDAEITARDESNARTRMRNAALPVAKTLDEFDVAASSIPQPTFDYLASLEWIRAAENSCLIGDLLRTQITQGEIPPGRAIPSKRRVQEEYGIGGHTYDRAVALLRDEGLVESVQGMGTFVKQRSPRN